MTALFYDVGTTESVIGGTSFGTHTEQVQSLERVTMKKGGNYLDGSPYILPLDKPYFIIKLNLLNDIERLVMRRAGNVLGADRDLQEDILRVLGAAPFTWSIGFAHTTFVEKEAFPYSLMPWTTNSVPRRPFQVIDNLKYKQGGSLSTGWSHSITLHVLPLNIDL